MSENKFPYKPWQLIKLQRDFTPEEVDQAIFQIHPLKAPGPDGYGACFFPKTLEHCWRKGKACCLAVS